ncbi:glycosyltransferase family 2 protein [Lujinxingia vulgaris]|uniref:Glycosyltransferase family 2 protein n=1 Tax=Lujinxingia vulgaris TaxID=2600176 RepID=A0A5C6XBA1_9DELT|nr:glycosyltransferase family 2 protein [Lujinxingia vulgaris]TXD36487.1 glycosyltransferase family 2 protein [Lujinxingia vulgaris]
MLEGKRVAVVVPAYCEETILPRTLAGLPGFIDHAIVVDDGSPDRTFEVAAALARVEARVDVVRLGFNQGVGRAIVRGYERALQLGADVVVVMAADDQMDPADLPAVLSPVLEGRADYVKGNRLRHPEIAKMPPLRRAGTAVLARLTSLVSGLEGLEDTQCGYTAISRQMLKALPLGELYPRYGYPNDMLIRLAERGARVIQPVVRPVYADEVSGLKISKVIVPISGILLRGAMRRVRRLSIADAPRGEVVTLRPDVGASTAAGAETGRWDDVAAAAE